jgi:DNA-binding MarR family transcriptional regulator
MPKNCRLVKEELEYARRARRDLVWLATKGGKRRLGEQQLRVAMFLVGSLSYHDARHVPVKEMAERLGMLQPNVSNMLTELTKLRLLAPAEKNADDGRAVLRRLWKRLTKNR